MKKPSTAPTSTVLRMKAIKAKSGAQHKAKPRHDARRNCLDDHADCGDADGKHLNTGEALSEKQETCQYIEHGFTKYPRLASTVRPTSMLQT